MSREQHAESVAVAHALIMSCSNWIGGAAEKQAEVLGAIALAVGDDPSNDAGRGALESAALLSEKLREALSLCEHIVAELHRYVGSF